MRQMLARAVHGGSLQGAGRDRTAAAHLKAPASQRALDVQPLHLNGERLQEEDAAQHHAHCIRCD